MLNKTNDKDIANPRPILKTSILAQINIHFLKGKESLINAKKKKKKKKKPVRNLTNINTQIQKDKRRRQQRTGTELAVKVPLAETEKELRSPETSVRLGRGGTGHGSWQLNERRDTAGVRRFARARGGSGRRRIESIVSGSISSL